MTKIAIVDTVLVNNAPEISPSPELLEINALYRSTLTELVFQRRQIEQQIQAIKEEGETLHNYWLEEYTKEKSGKSYHYVQLRWVSSQSGRTRIRGQAVPRKQVAEIRSQLARGKRIEMLEQQTQQVQDKIDRLNQLVLLFHNDLRQFITRTIRR